MILDMEGILMGGGRADKGINKNQKNIEMHFSLRQLLVKPSKVHCSHCSLTPDHSSIFDDNVADFT